MLWLFVLAIVMPIGMGSCDDVNLAKIKWAHAVNDWNLLEKALNDGK